VTSYKTTLTLEGSDGTKLQLEDTLMAVNQPSACPPLRQDTTKPGTDQALRVGGPAKYDAQIPICELSGALRTSPA
jgi:hypothetical protein